MSTETRSELTDTTLVILSAAAARRGGAVLPIPTSSKARGAALKAVLARLLRAGLIAERPAADGDELWRIDEDTGVRLALVVTRTALAAIGCADEPEPHDLPANDDVGAATDEEAPAQEDGGDAAVDRPVSGAATSDADATARRAAPSPRAGSKAATVVDLLQRDTGATVVELMAATGWQAHSVRGFLSGTVRAKLGRAVTSAKDEAGTRRYRVVA